MILVTGGSGLVGSRLLYDLVAGQNSPVRALRRESSDLSIVKYYFKKRPDLFHKIEWVNGDLLDIASLEDAFTGIDEVYHCAAFVSFKSGDYHPMMKVNVSGTANMVNIALEKGVKRFCHVSSVAALGRKQGENTIDENAQWEKSKYNSNYAISKYGAEREVYRAMAEGLPAFIVNPCIILGPGDWTTGSSALFKRMHDGFKFYTDGISTYVDVRDVTAVMIELMKRNNTEERFIISGESLSFKEIFTFISRAFNKPAPSIKVGKWVSGIGWRSEAVLSVLLGKEPIITKETARQAFIKNYYKNDKIKKILNWNFIPIQQSIKYTADAFLEMNAAD